MDEIAEKTGKETRGMIILMGLGKVKLTVIRESIIRNIPIVTSEGVKILAKKVGMPYY